MNSISLIYTSHLIPISHCLDYYSFVVIFVIGMFEFSKCVPYISMWILETSRQFLHIRQLNFYKCYISLENIAIATILILPTHEYVVSIHLFSSSLVFFSNGLYILESRPCTSYVKFIPRYYFNTIIKNVFLNITYRLFIDSVLKCKWFVCIDFLPWNIAEIIY